MKNIREKSIRIHHIDGSQKPFIFHHHQGVNIKIKQNMILLKFPFNLNCQIIFRRKISILFKV